MSIHVIFFGGAQSTQRNVDTWKSSAEKQRKDVRFDVFPFPKGGFGKYDEVIKMIKDVDADALFIVGHSSGCAIANELNSRLPESKSITLVDLDGFRVKDSQRKKSIVQPWWAEGPKGVGQSKNWTSGTIKYTALYATNKWSLHFSLVNTEATDAINEDTWWKDGYDDCRANLCFLDYKP